MRPLATLLLATSCALLPVAALADSSAGPPACTSPGSVDCPTYERYENRKFGFTVDVPTFFTRRPPDADGRGQPFDYGGKARVRAWAMYDNPPMTVEQLYGDWTRRDGVTFKALAVNTWVVRVREGGRLFYSRSILADGIISTVEVSYSAEVADAFEPILARLGASLMIVAGEGVRGHRGDGH